MTKVIVLGHGGYGTAIRRNIAMVVGTFDDDLRFVDFNEEDGLEELQAKIYEAVASCGEDDILFCCDIMGGSPFRLAATMSAGAPGRMITVTGLNLGAFAEIVTSLDLPVGELADLAMDAAKLSVGCFPPKA